MVRADALKIDKHIKCFEELSALHEEFPTAWQLIWKLINNYKRWNCSVFCERTSLDKDIYYRAKRNDHSIPTLHTIMTICVNMDLDKASTEELLLAAGIHLNRAIPAHRAYLYVINNLAAEPLAIRKKFLNYQGLSKPPSGKFNKNAS